MTMRSEITSVLTSYLQEGGLLVKVVGGSAAVVLAALWESLTGALAVILAVLFVCDLFLGVLKAVHKGGVDAFNWRRFSRAWIKYAAAILGIAVFSAGDGLLHQVGMDPEWHPLTSAGLVGMSWGFFASALASFGYFFPEVRDSVTKVLERVSPPRDPPKRRSGDDPECAP